MGKEKKMMLDDFLAMIPKEDRERIDKLVDEKLKIMEKEFVPYELALKMKLLGFDEPCWGYYDVNEGYSTGYAFCYSDRESQPEIGCSAPLYQQAFRWFRKKYNIQGYIYSSTVRGNSEKTKQFTGYIWNINGIDMSFLSTDARDELHDTYEEAELACLTKLIEIVEQTKN